MGKTHYLFSLIKKPSSHNAWILKPWLLFLFVQRLAGKPGLEPILLTQRNKAGEFFYNINEEISFPTPNLLHKLNKNIMFPGTYPRVRVSLEQSFFDYCKT